MLGILLYGVIIAYTADSVLSQEEKNKSHVTFKDYMDQFNPSQVWRDIEESNKLKGLNNSFKDELDNIIRNIDETDELLGIKVKNGNPKLLLDKNGRRQFKPTGRIDPNKAKNDFFSVRQRLVELMKQAIYQARNKMVIMQELRHKYRKTSLYKMGFLISKTDIACRIFTRFSYKAFTFCTMSRQYGTTGFPLQDNLEVLERVMDLWFDVDLLIDLVSLNNENCLRTLNQVVSNKKNEWQFVD